MALPCPTGAFKCCWLCVSLDAPGVIDEDGTERDPGLTLESVVSVPALSLPPSNVSVVLGGGDGLLDAKDVTLQVGNWANGHTLKLKPSISVRS